MRPAKEDTPCRTKQEIDLVSAIKELHPLSSQELSKLIRDADNDTIQWTTSNGSSNQIDVEALARNIVIHLIAKLLSSKQDEELFRYLLGGLRLLHALCDLAPRNNKLEQILLDDLKVSEQMFDLIFFMITVLADFKKESQLALLHSALLACSLYLLTSFISSQWHELALVLLAHPKVDIFMPSAFDAVHTDIQFLQVKLSQFTDTGIQSNLAEVNRLCQHCEASLQFLQSLCQQRFFRERLVKNKELCGEGGILLLAHDIMKLPFCEDPYLMAVVSRLKSKVLSILLHLCEVESVSFLDVAASTTEGLTLAKSTIFQVLELLRTMFRGDLAFSDKTYPRGLLQLNAMRLTDILSDDSNFRSYITLNFTEILTTIFLLPHAEFLASWCSSESRLSEEDATLDYDSLAAAGWVLGVLTSSDVPESTFNACRVSRTSYAFQRTSLLVKVVANLTCFIPDLCKEEKDLFLNTFLQCLQKEIPNLPYGVSNDVGAEKAAIISQNLRSLSVHAESLIPGFLNQDDVQLFRLFTAQLEPLITPESNINQIEEGNGGNQGSPNPHGNENTDHSVVEELNQLNVGNEDPSDGLFRQEQRIDLPQTFTPRVVQESEENAQNIDTNGVDSNAMQSEEKQMRKRKRNIMNHMQITMIEQALQNEPDMQRKAASIQLWADKLSLHGSEISASQLKNWLNNRKAKLARAAAKDARVASGGEKQGGGSGTDPVSDTPESPDEFFDQPPPPLSTTGQGSQQQHNRNLEAQYVAADAQGEEIAKTGGMWLGNNNIDEQQNPPTLDNNKQH